MAPLYTALAITSSVLFHSAESFVPILASSYRSSWERTSQSTAAASSYFSTATIKKPAQHASSSGSLSFEDLAPSAAPPSSFEKRMRQLAMPGRRRGQQPKVPQQQRHDVFVVKSLDEFKQVVAEEKERLVVVRYYATWCRACKQMAPMFYRAARMNPSVKFVEVPISDKNSQLHQGLGVPSVPFCHIYHPTGGLVEEHKFSRKYFAQVERTLQTYIQGWCEYPKFVPELLLKHDDDEDDNF